MSIMILSSSNENSSIEGTTGWKVVQNEQTGWKVVQNNQEPFFFLFSLAYARPYVLHFNLNKSYEVPGLSVTRFVPFRW